MIERRIDILDELINEWMDRIGFHAEEFNFNNRLVIATGLLRLDHVNLL